MVPDNYTLTFTSPTSYQIVDNTTVHRGPEWQLHQRHCDPVPGRAGDVSGLPAAGDSFAVAPSANQSMFATLTQLTAVLSQPADTAPARRSWRRAWEMS